MIIKKLFPKFQLLIGEKSIDLFNHFNVESLHGLKKKEAENFNETKDNAYIWGMANYSPNDYDLPYIFLNKSRFKYDYTDATAIMHETMHMALLLNDWNIENKEEKIITQAENMANDIIEFLKTKHNENTKIKQNYRFNGWYDYINVFYNNVQCYLSTCNTCKSKTCCQNT